MLTMFDLRSLGEEHLWTHLPTAADLESFMAAHPEIQCVNFTGTWMPQRPVSIEHVDAKMIRKQYRYAKQKVSQS